MKLLQMQSHCNDNVISVNISIKDMAYSFDYDCYKHAVSISKRYWHNPEIHTYRLL